MPTLRPHLKGWKAFGTLVLCNRNISRYLHMNYALLQLFHQAKVTLRFSRLFPLGDFPRKAFFSHGISLLRPRVSFYFVFFFSLHIFKLDFPISIERQFSSMSFYFSYFVSLPLLFLCINLKIAEVKQPYGIVLWQCEIATTGHYDWVSRYVYRESCIKVNCVLVLLSQQTVSDVPGAVLAITEHVINSWDACLCVQKAKKSM